MARSQHRRRTAGALTIEKKNREPDFCQDLGEASELTPNAQRVASALCVNRVSQQKFTPRNLLIILKIIYEQYIIIHLMKECFIPNHVISFLYGMCSRLDEQEALFAREQKSTRTKVMLTACIMLGLAKWENELNVSNKCSAYAFLQK